MLWDIDGTLVQAGELGEVVFHEAIEDTLGYRPPRRVPTAGKTDPQIIGDYLDLLGVHGDDHTISRTLAHLEGRFVRSRSELARTGQVCDGARAILSQLSQNPRVVSSVLTGNIQPNALVKLAAFDLDQWVRLEIGAYGSDDADRTKLVPVALRRFEEQYRARLAPEAVWVVGDTPKDLACARSAGAHCLLVATGAYPLCSLRTLGADEVVADLRATDDIYAILTAGMA